MGPWKDEVGAYFHAMLCVLWRRNHGRRGCDYVKGGDRCLTCNMSCIHLVGDVDGVDVTGVVDVADMTDAGSEVVPRMEQGSRRLRPRSKDLRSILPLLARYSSGLRKDCVLEVAMGMARAVSCTRRTKRRRHLADSKQLVACACSRTCLDRNEGRSRTCLGRASRSRKDPRS